MKTTLSYPFTPDQLRRAMDCANSDRKLSYGLNILMTGLVGSHLFKEMTELEWDALFNSTSPTPKRLRGSLEADLQIPKDGKIETWLHRYIRTLNLGELIRLIQFITASELSYPQDKIMI